MLTFGRYAGPDRDHTVLLNEAVQSFLMQDYGNKELVIVNDTPGQTVNFSHPEVIVMNCPERFKSLGAKRNAAIHRSTGDYLFVWDDDDIHLPWRLSQGVRWFQEHQFDYCGTAKYWYSERNTHYTGESAPVLGAMCSASYTRDAVCDVPYRNISVCEDQKLVADFLRLKKKTGAGHCPLSEAAVIYRWNYLANHVSGYPNNQGYEILGRKEYPPHDIYIDPFWQKDYVVETRINLA